MSRRNIYMSESFLPYVVLNEHLDEFMIGCIGPLGTSNRYYSTWYTICTLEQSPQVVVILPNYFLYADECHDASSLTPSMGSILLWPSITLTVYNDRDLYSIQYQLSGSTIQINIFSYRGSSNMISSQYGICGLFYALK